MSEESRSSSLLSASVLSFKSAPLIIFAYAVVATVIAGFAAPAAGLAILALGLITALSLAVAESRRSEGSDRLEAAASASGASYVFAPNERSSRAYLRTAQLRASAARTEGESRSTSMAPADTPSEASREGASSGVERGARSGSPRLVPSNQIPGTPDAA